MPGLDEVTLGALLGRALELADEDLDGINDAALELAELAGGDVSLMTAAIRRIRNEVDAGDRRETSAWVRAGYWFAVVGEFNGESRR